jgi:hypothetical protein
MPMSRGSQARIRPVRPGCNRSDSGTTLAPRPGPFLGDASLFFAPVLTRALTSKTCRRALGGQQALGLYVVMRQMNPTAIVAVPAPSAHLLPRRPRRRQRTAKPLRRSVRLLGPTSKAVKAALRTAWNEARLALLGSPAPNLRKG